MYEAGLHPPRFSQSGGLAQLARAPALQAGGQRFESVILHQWDRIGEANPNLDTKVERSHRVL